MKRKIIKRFIYNSHEQIRQRFKQLEVRWNYYKRHKTLNLDTIPQELESGRCFGLERKLFFGELATLIDVMLLGHWIEMQSVMGASKVFEKLAKLMPGSAHLVRGRDVADVKISNLPPTPFGKIKTKNIF